MSDLRTRPTPVTAEVTQSTESTQSTEPTASWKPLCAVLVGTFVTFLDFFIVNVALPSMATDLRAGPASVSLVVAGYGLTFAAGMIAGGRLGDLVGRRRMFLLGLALFTLASLVCGVAPSIEVLVGARLAQGAAGALLTPQVLAIIGTQYAGAQVQRAFAAYGFAMGVAGVLGQLIGGVLIHLDPAGLGWRTIFLINVPIGLAVLPWARRVLPESYGARTRLDWRGLTTVTVALLALVLPLVEGREHGWPWWTWVSLALVPVLAVWFVWLQRRATDPLVDLTLFCSRSFAVGSLVAVSFSMVPPSFFFVLALYLQQGRGLGALASGVIFVAVGVGYFAAMLTATAVAARFGRQVLALGAGVVALGCLTLVGTAHSSSSVALVPGLALVGFGIGWVLVPLAATVLTGVDPLHAGAAAGVLATAQQVGAAVGVAILSSVFFAAGTVVSAFVVSLWLLIGLTGLAASVVQLLGDPRVEREQATS